MRDKKNTGATLPMQPVAPVVHNHAQNHAAEIAVAVLCLPIVAYLIWLAVELMMAQFDVKNAGRNTAALFLSLPVFFLLCWVGGAIIDKGGALYKDIKAMNLEANLAAKRLELQAAQVTATSERTLDAQDNKAMLALEILQEAYNTHPQGKPYGNEARPWRGDNPKGIADHKQIEIKYLEARRMAVWLLDNNLITPDDQLNYARFPQYRDAMRYIKSMYTLPIVINGQSTALPYRETTSIIAGVK